MRECFVSTIDIRGHYSPSLRFMFGVMVSPDSDIKVLPMAGFDWAINERFDLRLMFPKPRLIYKPNEHWRFHVGADLNMATFRTSDSLGASIGLPRYNDALGTYRDIRVGVGGGYQLTTLATKKVTIYTEILLSCEYCVEQNLLPRAHLRGIFNRESLKLLTRRYLNSGQGNKRTLTLEADAGYSVSRQIDYTRIDERVKFDPAPYVRINLRWSF